MHISNGCKLAIFKYRQAVYNGCEFEHILAWYRHKLKNGV